MATALRSESERCRIQLVQVLHVANHRTLRAAIVAALDRGVSHVIVDCTGWDRLDLAVLSALVQGAKACAARGAEFELANLERALEADISALRLSDRLGLCA